MKIMRIQFKYGYHEEFRENNNPTLLLCKLDRTEVLHNNNLFTKRYYSGKYHTTARNFNVIPVNANNTLTMQQTANIHMSKKS